MNARMVRRGSILLGGLALLFGAGAVGQLVAKRLTTGDESSDVFRLAAVLGGAEFDGRSTALRSGRALAVMGGVEIDLRDAQLSSSGATLDIRTVMGGVEVKLPRDWLVDVQSHGNLGGVATRLTDAADLPDGAPRLQVTTNTWLGGIEIRQER